MVSTRAGSSTSPPDRAGSPPAPPDGTGTQAVLPDRVATPPVPSRMFGTLSAPIADESDVFKHVLTNVLKQPSDSPLARALDEASINEINDLLTLDHHSRNVLTYKHLDDTNKPLPIGHKNLIRVLKIFADFCQDSGRPIEDWTTVTKKDFDDFRTSRAGLALSEKNDTFSISTPNPVIVPSPSPSPPAPKQKDLLSKFKKGIKRDASLFVILKDLKQWDSWHRSTVAQARAQDVYDVLDPVRIGDGGPIFYGCA